VAGREGCFSRMVLEAVAGVVDDLVAGSPKASS
jgi:hypothetical protein